MKARWITPSVSLAPLLQALEVLSEPRWTSAPSFSSAAAFASERARPSDLMAVGDQFLGRCGADKSGGAGDEYAHEKHSLFRRAGYCYVAHAGKVVRLYGYNR